MEYCQGVPLHRDDEWKQTGKFVSGRVELYTELSESTEYTHRRKG